MRRAKPGLFNSLNLLSLQTGRSVYRATALTALLESKRKTLPHLRSSKLPLGSEEPLFTTRFSATLTDEEVEKLLKDEIVELPGAISTLSGRRREMLVGSEDFVDETDSMGPYMKAVHWELHSE